MHMQEERSQPTRNLRSSIKQEEDTSNLAVKTEMRSQRNKKNISYKVDLAPASKKISKKKPSDKKSSKRSKGGSFSRQPWTSEEDSLLIEYVKKLGQCWSEIARNMGGIRTHRQIRRRYLNELDPNIKKTAWTPEEDKILFEKYKVLGRKWTEIAKFLPGRGEFAIKNRALSQLRKLKIEESQDKTKSKINNKRTKQEETSKNIIDEKDETDSSSTEKDKVNPPITSDLFHQGYLANLHFYNFIQQPAPTMNNICIEDFTQSQGYDEYGIERFLDFTQKTAMLNQYLYKEDPMTDLYRGGTCVSSNIQDTRVDGAEHRFFQNHEIEFPDFGRTDSAMLKKEEPYWSLF